jgi:hypothetical protein
VSVGAIWDTKCDELVSSGEAREDTPVLRLCMALWSQELADGLPLPFTTITDEVVMRGADSIQAYIDDLKKSREVVFRRKICLVGCGCAGKTSLIKSIKYEKPQLALNTWQFHWYLTTLRQTEMARHGARRVRIGVSGLISRFHATCVCATLSHFYD